MLASKPTLVATATRLSRWWLVCLLSVLVAVPSLVVASSGAWVASDSAGGAALQTSSWMGQATQLAFVTSPQVIETSPGSSGTVMIREEDGSGDPVRANASLTISLTSTSSNLTFSSGTTATIAAGAQATSFTLLDSVDTVPEQITASAPGLLGATQSEAFNAVGNRTALTVGNQSGVLNPAGTAAFSVQVDNTGGNTQGYSLTNVGGLPPGASWTASPGCVTIAGGASSTVTLTVVTTTAAPASASAYTLALTVTRWDGGGTCNPSSGIYEEVEGTGSLTVAPGAAAAVAFVVQPSGATASGAAFPVQPMVAVVDAYGNVVTAGAASVTLALGGTGALSGCTTALNTTGGVAAFAGCAVSGTVDIVSDTLSATATGGFTATVTSNPFNISASAAKLVYSTEPGGDAATGLLSPQPAVAVEDASGHLVTASSASVALSASSGSLACPASGTTVGASYGVATFGACAIGTAGSGKTLTASSSSLAGATSTAVSVTLSAPTISSPSSSAPATLAVTETASVVITGTNFAQGSTVTDTGGHFSIDGWTVTNASTITVTVTCTATGTDALTVTNPDGGSATASGSIS